jgi:hypothetical protein
VTITSKQYQKSTHRFYETLDTCRTILRLDHCTPAKVLLLMPHAHNLTHLSGSGEQTRPYKSFSLYLVRLSLLMLTQKQPGAGRVFTV